VQHEADPAGHALEEPDVRHRHRQIDVAHAFTAHAGQGHFHTATITDDAAMLDALVLAAGAFPVLHGTENALAEQAALLGLERTIIDRLGILDLTLGPRPDDVW